MIINLIELIHNIRKVINLNRSNLKNLSWAPSTKKSLTYNNLSNNKTPTNSNYTNKSNKREANSINLKEETKSWNH